LNSVAINARPQEMVHIPGLMMRPSVTSTGREPGQWSPKLAGI